jgi:hypothetical protein
MTIPVLVDETHGAHLAGTVAMSYLKFNEIHYEPRLVTRLKYWHASTQEAPASRLSHQVVRPGLRAGYRCDLFKKNPKVEPRRSQG